MIMSVAFGGVEAPKLLRTLLLEQKAGLMAVQRKNSLTFKTREDIVAVLETRGLLMKENARRITV
jgi:hypothetical protein